MDSPFSSFVLTVVLASLKSAPFRYFFFSSSRKAPKKRKKSKKSQKKVFVELFLLCSLFSPTLKWKFASFSLWLGFKFAQANLQMTKQEETGHITRANSNWDLPSDLASLRRSGWTRLGWLVRAGPRGKTNFIPCSKIPTWKLQLASSNQHQRHASLAAQPAEEKLPRPPFSRLVSSWVGLVLAGSFQLSATSLYSHASQTSVRLHPILILISFPSLIADF